MDRPTDTLTDAAAYVQMWRRMRTLFAEEGVDRVEWIWCPTDWAFNPASGRTPQRWYPGDDAVDWLCADGYGFYPETPTWTSFETTLGFFYRWAEGRGKPIMIGETGAMEDPATPGRKGAWFQELAETVRCRWTEVDAVVLFDEEKHEQGVVRDWRIASSESSIAGAPPSPTRSSAAAARTAAARRPTPEPGGAGGPCGRRAPADAALRSGLDEVLDRADPAVQPVGDQERAGGVDVHRERALEHRGIGAAPSPANPSTPVPATVSRTPPATRRTRLLFDSVISTSPLGSTSTLFGLCRLPCVGSPPSPPFAAMPLPANVVMMPAALTMRTRSLL